MPNIRQFDNPVGGLNPNNAGVNAMVSLAGSQASSMASVGNSIEGGVNAIGQVVAEYQERNEFSKGGALSATILDNLTNRWKETAKTAPANDSSISATFREKDLEPALEQFLDGFQTENGRKWAQNQADQIRDHFYKVTSADVSTRAGIAAVENIETTVRSLANVAHNDPTALDMTLDMVDSYMKNVKGPLSLDPTASAKIDASVGEQKRALVTQSLAGRAKADPVQFLKELAEGAFEKYNSIIGPEDKKQIEGYARTYASVQREAENAARIEQERAAKDRSNAAAISIVASGRRQDGTYFMPGKAFDDIVEIAKENGQEAGMVTSMFSAFRAINEDATASRKVADDPRVYEDFSQRAFLPQTDDRALTLKELSQARIDRKLSDSSFGYFTTALNDKVQDPKLAERQKKLDQWFTSVKGFITKSTQFTVDPNVSADKYWGDFMRDKQAQFDAGIAAGISVEEMLDQTSKQFIGQDITRYSVASLKAARQSVKTMSSAERPLPPPVDLSPDETPPTRADGETPAAFLGRRKAFDERLKGAVKPPLKPKAPTPTLYEFNERFGE